MIENPIPVALTLVACVGAGLVLEQRFAWARKLGASLLVILAGAVISNLGWVTSASPVYEVIFGPVTSLAIVWLLLAVDLRELRRAGPPMLIAFAVALVGTAVGSLVAFALIGSAFPENAWRLAGVMTGTYSGGSLNFVAVGRAVELPEALFVAAAAADNVMTTVWMAATIVLPVWLVRFSRRRKPETDGAATPEPAVAGLAGLTDDVALRLPDVAGLFVVGLGLIAASEAIAGWLPAVPSVLWLTTLTLVAAQIPVVRNLRGSLLLGIFALNLFFAVLGIASRISEILAVGPEVFYFTALVVLVHGVILFGFALLRGTDLDTVAVASQAAVGGPSTAMALAVARGRAELALPGVLLGLAGYAAGNYAGLAIAHLVRSFGG